MPTILDCAFRTLRSGPWRQEDHMGGLADSTSCGLAFVAAEVVEDHDITVGKRRHEYLLDIHSESSPLIGPSMTHGASTRSMRRAAMKGLSMT
jgi:hypothetical protein